jgi:hypothetical protein
MENLISKLKGLTSKYFLAGYYIIDLPSNFNYELKFDEIYNSYLEASILESIVSVKLFDIPNEVVIHKPLNQVHRYEFEEHFGFGGHCKGFDLNKKIIYCPKYPIMPFDELSTKLNLSSVNEDTIKELCLLMILGGYWNKRQAVTDLLDFSQSEFGITGIKTDDIFEYLFQKIKLVN